jgi:hypothetical protein
MYYTILLVFVDGLLMLLMLIKSLGKDRWVEPKNDRAWIKQYEMIQTIIDPQLL